VCTGNDDLGESPSFEHWIEGESRKNDIDWFENLTKDEFLDLVLQKVEVQPVLKNLLSSPEILYRFGDLGPVYGTQWRAFGNGIFRDKENDQIQRIIDTLKTNPNDRRMLCVAFNPDQLCNMALPPCHVMFQFYTRPLKNEERWELYRQKYENEPYDGSYGKPHLEIWGDTRLFTYRGEHDHKLDEENIPKYALSCMYTMRSNDIFLGSPFNISSYGILTCMIAKLVNMIPDELVASLGDCHIYKAHFDAVKEQLARNGSDIIPKLIIKGNQKSIEDFKYEDFEILDYYPDPAIRAPLLVG
jgi:thymidylate synthase